MSIKRFVVNMLEDLLLIGLAIDELYLYYAGAWSDPVTVIRIAELVILWGLIPFGVWRMIEHWKEEKHVPGMDKRGV